MQNLNEAYFGKNKNLLLIEKNFQVILDEYANNKGTLFTLDSSPKSKTALATIEKLLENEFGFHKVAITIHYGIPGINALTFLQPVHKKLTNKFIRTKNGMRCVSSNADMVIMIGSEMFKNNLTAGELTAVTLHEVGHNFFSNNNISTIIMQEFTNIPYYIQDPLAIIGTLNYEFIISKTLPYFIEATKQSGIKTICDTLGIGNRIISVLKTLSLTPLILKNFTRVILNQIIKAPFRLIDTIVGGAADEKFADNFATAYGYGPETTSAFTKFDYIPSSDLDKIVVLRPIYDIIFAPSKIIAYMVDPHPNSYARIKDQISYAKQQLNSVKDPKLKKMLSQQIKQMEDAEKTYSDMVAKANLKNGKPITALITSITIALGGKSVHDLLDTKDSKTKDWKQFRSSDGLFD